VLEAKTRIQLLGYLYLGFAYVSDSDLDSSEITEFEKKVAELLKMIQVYDPTKEQLDREIGEIYKWYKATIPMRRKLVGDIAQFIARKSWFTTDMKTRVLNDLNDLARADGQFKIDERNMISQFASKWGVHRY